MCLEVTCISETLFWVPPPPLPPQYPGNMNLLNLNLKSGDDRRKRFEGWSVESMDKDRPAAAGFYYTIRGDIVPCAFCGMKVGRWQEGDSPLDDHKRFSPSCGSLRAFLLEIFLLTSLKHLKNLPVVKRCADVVERLSF
jgi:hypothetical protein